AYADEKLADASRTGVTDIIASVSGRPGRVWFEGHWGFQYYMEQAGATAVDENKMAEIKKGDFVVIPIENADVRDLRADQFQQISSPNVEACEWCATQDRRVGAGFYASGEGPLPFVFARVPPQDFKVYERVKEFTKPAGETAGAENPPKPA